MYNRNGKPTVRWGRKVMGLREADCQTAEDMFSSVVLFNSVLSSTTQSLRRMTMFKRYVFSIFLVLALAFGSFAPAVADGAGPLEPPAVPPSAETGQLVDETPGLWFVELSGAPISEGNTAAGINTEHKRFRDNARRAGVSYRERYSYESLWNGFSISASTAELGKLSRLPGVMAIYPV